jgi:hypothetical protein
MSDARALLGELIAARDAGSAGRTAALLGDDVRYWDARHGELSGREAVAAALTAGTPVELETIAAAGDDAVVELQVARRYRSTEVYTLENGAIVSIKAYFDPSAL